ncbi:hypothetical protein ACQ661_00490 [Pseudidiomarina sp. WS423]|uniref:hypothetical protein n=1 Tax=Pseudidiomarina sp. WS423 TaxID=3425124 RepID=UPI003D6DED0A
MSFAIIQTSPINHPAIWHGQDMLLALASLDLNPQLILTGAAVQAWLSNQDQQRPGQSLHKRYALLELFDCPNVWIQASEYLAAGGANSNWIATVEVIDDELWSARLEEFQHVLRY